MAHQPQSIYIGTLENSCLPVLKIYYNYVAKYIQENFKLGNLLNSKHSCVHLELSYKEFMPLNAFLFGLNKKNMHFILHSDVFNAFNGLISLTITVRNNKCIRLQSLLDLCQDMQLMLSVNSIEEHKQSFIF